MAGRLMTPESTHTSKRLTRGSRLGQSLLHCVWVVKNESKKGYRGKLETVSG